MNDKPTLAGSRAFQEAFCEKFGCGERDYELKVFRKCLHTHAWAFVWLWLWNPKAFFAEDYQFIREAASVTCGAVFRMEVDRFHGRNVRDKNWARRVFKIRLSGKKLRKLNSRLLRRLHPWNDLLGRGTTTPKR